MQPQKVSLDTDVVRFGWSDQGDFAAFDVAKGSPNPPCKAVIPASDAAGYASEQCFWLSEHDRTEKRDLQI
jgi:hypothetical protein